MPDFSTNVPEVSPTTGFTMLQGGATAFVDVREPDEWATGHIPGALHVPLATLPEAVATLPEGALVLVCRSGARSERATEYLLRRGRTDVHNLAGGMLGWEAAGLPVVTE